MMTIFLIFVFLFMMIPTIILGICTAIMILEDFRSFMAFFLIFLIPAIPTFFLGYNIYQRLTL